MQNIDNENFDLIRNYQQGDEQSFSKLFYKYYPDVYKTLIIKGISKDDAEDATAEIFIKLADSLKSYHFDKPFEHYLRRIARNKIFDFYRARHAEWFPLVIENIITENMSAFETSDIEEVINLCLQQILNLTRRAVIVSWLEGYKRKQIAELLKLPIGTVHSHLERGKTDFRKCIRGNLS